MADKEEKKPRDWWDKADIILKPLGGILTAVAIAWLGFHSSSILNNRQAEETRVKLYSELMSKREEAESSLRKDMFTSIIQSFVGSGNQKPPLEKEILNLELLAYNFHEALNLKPLFSHLKKEIEKSGARGKAAYLERLNQVAREIVRKQVLMLESAGKRFDRSLDLKYLKAMPEGVPLDEAVLSLDNIERKFRLKAMEVNRDRQEVKLRLEIIQTKGKETGETVNTAEFWVGFYDFPMIDNTRLSHDQRCAIIVNAFGKESVEIGCVYFPGSYASLKEKPYYQDVVQKLIKNADNPGKE